jgi:hypothetical protein
MLAVRGVTPQQSLPPCGRKPERHDTDPTPTLPAKTVKSTRSPIRVAADQPAPARGFHDLPVRLDDEELVPRRRGNDKGTATSREAPDLVAGTITG